MKIFEACTALFEGLGLMNFLNPWQFHGPWFEKWEEIISEGAFLFWWNCTFTIYFFNFHTFSKKFSRKIRHIKIRMGWSFKMDSNPLWYCFKMGNTDRAQLLSTSIHLYNHYWLDKVHVFLEDHKILRNLHYRFDRY